MNDLTPTSSGGTLPTGKLPPALLRDLLASLPQADEVVLGPGIGRDVAVVELEGHRLALKSDPITFATDEIGWYAVHVNANDLATVGAEPKWFLATLLLPEGRTDRALAARIVEDMVRAAEGVGVALVGGHTEITGGLSRPIVSGTMIGLLSQGVLVRPDGLRPGDAVLLTKGLAIEATAIIARELPDRLRSAGLSAEQIEEAARYLHDPGVSVLPDARIARKAGVVHAMHDPTEGGVVTALDELAEAANVGIDVDAAALANAMTPLTEAVCRAAGIDPRGAISSGALLVALAPERAALAQAALDQAGIPSHRIGTAVARRKGCRLIGPEAGPWPRFARDEIARLFER